MASAPTQPDPAEGAPDEQKPGNGGRPSAPTEPGPAEGGDDTPDGGAGSPADRAA